MKVIAGVLIALVLCTAIPGDRKEWILLISVAVCCGIGISAFVYLKPVIALLNRLQQIGNINFQLFSVLLKVVGVGIVSELASLICTDMGNGALGKTIQLLSTAAILWLTIPLFDELLILIEEVLLEI